MSLRRRLIALFLFILPLSLLFGGILTYWQARQKVATEMTAAMALGEATVGDALLSLGKTAEPLSVLSRLVHSFDGERHLRVSLLDGTGAVVSASHIVPPVRPAPGWLSRVLGETAMSKDIALPGPAQGHVRVTADPTNELGEVWEDVALKLKIIAGFFLLLLAAVYGTMDRALRPLDKLAVALSEVERGNFTAHVDETGPKELVAIYRAFNRMADGLKAAEAQNMALTQQLNAVQEEERKDLARDLHDEIGPFLFAVDVDAQTIPEYLQRGATDEVAARAGAIRQSVKHMQRHLRDILNRLRPAMLLELGFAQAVDQLIAFWQRRHPDIAITAEISQASYGDEIDEIAFRTVQEAMNNAVRHAKPKSILIKAALDAQGRALALSIRDDGVGLAPAPASATGFGIAGMRERAAAVGGSLDVTPNGAASGVTVSAYLPLHSKSADVTRADRGSPLV